MTIENPTQEDIWRILKSKKRVAIVGLSDKPNRDSYEVAKALQEAGYNIIPVNPTISEVLGVKAVAKLADIQGHVDIVDVFRRGEVLPELAKEVVDIQADVFWGQLGVINEEAYTYLKENGIEVIMDRCMKVEHSLMHS